MTARYLAILECPHGYRAIGLESESVGIRLVGSKCCGKWKTVDRWRMDIAEILDELDARASDEVDEWFFVRES